MKHLDPYAGRVLVRADEKADSFGSILLPDTARERTVFGEVILVGPGVVSNKGIRLERQVFPGDRVLFAKFAGDPVEIADEQYLLMREGEILGVVE
jgi:chaperonin GroES